MTDDNNNPEVPSEDSLEALGFTDFLKDTEKAIEEFWGRPVTPDEVAYLYDQYPYLQLLDNISLAEAGGGPKAGQQWDVEVLKTKCAGWQLLDYGFAFSTSPGEKLFQGGFQDDDEDGGSSGTGDGTLVKQSFDVAGELVNRAIEKGWRSFYITGGHPRMKWAAWWHATQKGIAVGGYMPTIEDYAKQEVIGRSEEEEKEIRDRARKTRKGPRSQR